MVTFVLGLGFGTKFGSWGGVGTNIEGGTGGGVGWGGVEHRTKTMTTIVVGEK